MVTTTTGAAITTTTLKMLDVHRIIIDKMAFGRKKSLITILANNGDHLVKKHSFNQDALRLKRRPLSLIIEDKSFLKPCFAQRRHYHRWPTSWTFPGSWSIEYKVTSNSHFSFFSLSTVFLNYSSSLSSFQCRHFSGSSSSDESLNQQEWSRKHPIVPIKLPISFVQGFFTIRFGRTNCLFHYWTPLDSVLRTLNEELQKINTIDCSNSQFMIDAEEMEEFHQIHIGRLKIFVESSSDSEQNDSITSQQLVSSTLPTSSSSSSNRICLASSVPLGHVVMAIDLDDIHLVSIGTATIKPKESSDQNDQVIQQLGKKPIEVRFLLFAKDRLMKVSMEKWQRDNPVEMKFQPKQQQQQQQTIIGTEFGRSSFQTEQPLQATVAEELKKESLDSAAVTTEPTESAPTPSTTISQQPQSIPASMPFINSELMFFEQERQAILAQYNPLQEQFQNLTKMAKQEANRKFKFGGLFLLSAQLGFVARLTWFEYSWDIMEPVTWMLTYATMVGSFAYYIITSEEYVIPMVEKRLTVGRFRKLVQIHQFDVRRYLLLRDELQRVDDQIYKLRTGIGF